MSKKFIVKEISVLELPYQDSLLLGEINNNHLIALFQNINENRDYHNPVYEIDIEDDGKLYPITPRVGVDFKQAEINKKIK